jgi:hypothetical protein
MTGLWTNDRAALAEAIFREYTGGKESWAKKNQRGRGRWLVQVDRLIDSGAVRVLDPDDTDLIEQVARAIARSVGSPTDPWSIYHSCACTVIEALRQP